MSDTDNAITEPPAGAAGDQAPDTTQEDVMAARGRNSEKDDTEKVDRASVLAPPSPGFASDLEVEQVAPMHYMKHRRTGEIAAVGNHGEYVELSHNGWALTDEVPEGAPAPTGGPAI